MSATDINRLLIVFAMLELALAAVLIGYFRTYAIGASQIVIGMSLIAVATASGKKKNNG